MRNDEMCCEVVELRRYSLKPGRRDSLIDLFERTLMEPQIDCGMHLIGQFTDADDPDKFVWLRGFTGMAERRTALEDFYFGPVWRVHRDEANATMEDSDDVLLLRPLPPGVRTGHADGASSRTEGRHIYTVEVQAGEAPGPSTPMHLADDQHLIPSVQVGAFAISHETNTFPALPVRADLWGVVVLGRHGDEAAARAYADSRSREGISVTVLRPTARSALR